MDRLAVGMHVEIMRSDGRVHGALVTKLSLDSTAVGVEWFEKGETKGKEVDLASIMRNNPMLFQQPTIPSPGLSSSKADGASSRLSLPNNVLAQHLIASQAVDTKPRESIIISNGGRLNLASQQPAPSAAPALPSNNSSQRRSMVLAPSGIAGATPLILASTNYNVNNNNAEKELVKRRTVLAPRIPPSRLSRILQNTNDLISKEEPENLDETTTVNSKSTVLSKVDEIAKNREHRRVQQVESKKLHEVQKNIDPGNPNWQFLSMIRDYQSQLDYKPLKLSDSVKDSRISVCVRKRPINKKELAKKEVEIITIPKKDHIIVHQPQVKVDLTKYLENQVFRFDYTFDDKNSNEMVYKFTAQPLVRTIFQGGFATCFAYGQTGSGKTHTMGGVFDGKTQNCVNGIYALTAIDVFKMLSSGEFKNEKLSVSCSFFEIYGAKVFDLLGNKAKLRVLEDGKKLVQVVGLKEFKVDNADDVLQLIKQGTDHRTAGQTSANSNSSRSHAVFQIILRKREGNKDNLFGKFSLIDLAGNERGADTISSDRQTRLEGAEINKSLLALKECIRAMGREVHHVPFRGSKLTLILRDSFIGKNAKTCMIAMISPGMSCVENTLNTLRYADRVKELGTDEGPILSKEDDLLNENNDMKGGEIDGFDDDQDLQMLHQRNSEFMDERAYKYQLAVENMNKAEDVAIDEHQSFVDKFKTFSGRLEQTNHVEYDMEAYARNSMKDIHEILNMAGKCKANFENLLERIAEEQELSRGK